VDWWEIERENTIRSAPRDTLIQYYDLFRDNWIRDSSGEVVAIDRRYINSGGSLMRGVELDANLNGELAGGRWNVHLNGSLITFKTKALETLPYTEPGRQVRALLQPADPLEAHAQLRLHARRLVAQPHPAASRRLFRRAASERGERQLHPAELEAAGGRLHHLQLQRDLDRHRGHQGHPSASRT
jgi:hypothetical protein